MIRPFLADLHIHSVLSPCADDLMLPSEIVATAVRRGLAVIGIADHNSAENVAAIAIAAQRKGLRVLPGIEVTTREEVHVLALFDSVAAAVAWQDYLYGHLPPLRNDERAFGTQLVVDEGDQIIRVNQRLLLTATDLSLGEVIAAVKRAGGVAIPAHVDRVAFGLLGQLGFVPADLDIPIVEVSRYTDPHEAVSLHPSLAGRAVLQSSDAHFLDEIGVAPTILWVEQPSLHELLLACHGSAGRRLAYRQDRG